MRSRAVDNNYEISHVTRMENTTGSISRFCLLLRIYFMLCTITWHVQDDEPIIPFKEHLGKVNLDHCITRVF